MIESVVLHYTLYLFKYNFCYLQVLTTKKKKNTQWFDIEENRNCVIALYNIIIYEHWNIRWTGSLTKYKKPKRAPEKKNRVERGNALNWIFKHNIFKMWTFLDMLPKILNKINNFLCS